MPVMHSFVVGVGGGWGWVGGCILACDRVFARACVSVSACVRVCDEMRASVGLCKRLGSLRDGAS